VIKETRNSEPDSWSLLLSCTDFWSSFYVVENVFM